MPSVNFTSRWVTAVTQAEGRVDYFDRKGLGEGRYLGLRVSEKTKTWFVMYKNRAGTLKRLSLGRYPTLGLADAREEADRQLRTILGGEDPAQKRRDHKEARTFHELAEAFIARQRSGEGRQRGPAKSWPRQEAILQREFIPHWGDLKARDVTRDDVIELVEAIAKRGSPVAANRALEVVRAMYYWALERPKREGWLLEYNPAHRVKKPGAENTRDRTLQDAELRALWRGLDTVRFTAPIRLALKLVLVTAQRKGEVIGAAKGEFDLEAGWWTIPGGRTKNRHTHRVPLSPLAQELISESWALSGGSPYLFPSPRCDKPILASAVDYAVRRNRDHFGIAHWIPHDLRRSAASRMASAGTPRLVIGKVLNHVDSSVTATYDRHSYDVEKREALEAWAQTLGAVLGLSNV